jgi:hypothetical protein
MEKLLEGHVFGGWGVRRRCGVVNLVCTISKMSLRNEIFFAEMDDLSSDVTQASRGCGCRLRISCEVGINTKWDDRFFLSREKLAVLACDCFAASIFVGPTQSSLQNRFNMNPESL